MKLDHLINKWQTVPHLQQATSELRQLLDDFEKIDVSNKQRFITKRDKKIVELLHNGLTVVEVSEQLNTNYWSVLQVAKSYKNIHGIKFTRKYNRHSRSD